MSDQPSTSAASTPESKPPTWRGAGTLPVTVAGLGSDTPNGGVISLLFDATRVALRRGDDAAAVRCTSVTVTTNVDAPGQRVRIRHDLRGQAIKHADARVSITADLAGSIQALEYPYGSEVDEQIDRTFESVVELRPGQPYVVTLVISAERRTDDADLIVALDSIDMAIIAEPPESDGGEAAGASGERA